MQSIRKFFFWINILLVLITCLSYLTPFVNPKNIWILTFLGLGYPWLLLANTLFILIWIVFKKWYFLLSVICLAFGYQHVLQFVNINTTTVPLVKNEFTLMTNNVSIVEYVLFSKNKTKAKKEYQEFIDEVNKVDIFCGQEVTMGGYKFLKEELSFPYSKPMAYGYLVLFSKFPILKIEEIQFDKTLNSSFWADLDINGTTVRLYNLHLQSTRVSIDAEELAKSKDLQNRESLSNVKSMMVKVKHATQMRATQANKIASHMKQCPYPIILCGDFNDTPLSYAFHLLSENLKDTFVEKGNGFASTYAGVIPALRIDYILTDPSIKVLEYQTHSTEFSDHYPISTRLALP